jgi:hypothetical protein
MNQEDDEASQVAMMSLKDNLGRRAIQGVLERLPGAN